MVRTYQCDMGSTDFDIKVILTLSRFVAMEDCFFVITHPSILCGHSDDVLGTVVYLVILYSNSRPSCSQ